MRAEAGLAAPTVNKEVKCLKRLFNLAADRGYLRRDANPCLKVQLLKVGQKRPPYMSPAKFEKVYAATRDPIVRTYLLILYTTGLRREEAMHLTWDDIEFDRAVLHVARHDANAEQYIQAWTPKDHERRELPVAAKAMELLAALRSSAPQGCPYVFMPEGRWLYYKACVDQKTWKPETSKLVNNLLRKFQTVCKRAAVGRFTLHDLRRSCITNWARQNLPMHVAQKLAGHADIQTTQEFYLSVQEEDMEKARLVQQKLVSGIAAAEPD